MIDSRIVLLRPSSARIAVSACLRAASFKDPRWIDRLGELLDDDTEIVRRNADFALFEIGKKELDALHSRRDVWLLGSTRKHRSRNRSCPC